MKKKLISLKKNWIRNNSLAPELSSIIKKLINRNHGIGSIFNYLRKLKFTRDIPNLGLFRLIVVEYGKSNKKLTKKSINYHFNSRVSKTDYNKLNKQKVLNDLHSLLR